MLAEKSFWNPFWKNWVFLHLCSSGEQLKLFVCAGWDSLVVVRWKDFCYFNFSTKRAPPALSLMGCLDNGDRQLAEISSSGLGRGGGHRALDGGQFRFWSNLKVPFYVHLRHLFIIWDISSHILWIKKQLMSTKFSKNVPQKQKKWENAPKQPILGMFWCVRLTKCVSLEFCRSCNVILCSFLANEDGWEAEKSWNSVKSGFFVSKIFDGGTCARSQTLRHEIDWNCLEILYSHLNFITGTKKKQYSM